MTLLANLNFSQSAWKWAMVLGGFVALAVGLPRFDPHHSSLGSASDRFSSRMDGRSATGAFAGAKGGCGCRGVGGGAEFPADSGSLAWSDRGDSLSRHNFSAGHVRRQSTEILDGASSSPISNAGRQLWAGYWFVS
jgi:hypothetical protein